MPIETQVLRNFHVTEDSESIERYSFTKFTIGDFFQEQYGRSFNSHLKTLWSTQTSPFFRNHTPKLVFMQYGQNVRMENGQEVMEYIAKDFDVSRAASVQLSLAINVGAEKVEINHSEVEDAEEHMLEAEENLVEDGLGDPNINEMFERTNPQRNYSLCLTRTSVESLFGGPNLSGVNLFRKAFNPAFVNFQASYVPASFFENVSENIRMVGFQGYSTVSHLLRRTSKSEPFSSNPFAMMLSQIGVSDCNLRKYYKLIKQDLQNLAIDIDVFNNKGSDYRFEITFEFQPTDQHVDLVNDLDVLIRSFCAAALAKCVDHGVLYPTSVFPAAISVFTKSILQCARPLVERCIQSPSSITTTEKEMGSFLEALVIRIKEGIILY
jgi:hypothetical protein